MIRLHSPQVNFFLTPSKIFVILLLLFLLGIFLGPVFPIDKVLNGYAVVVLIAVLFLGFFLVKNEAGRLLVLTFIGLLVLIMGVWRYQLYLPVIDERHIGYYNDNGVKLFLQGAISAEPDIREDYIKLQVGDLRFWSSNDKIQTIDKSQKENHLQGKVLLNMPQHTKIQYGDMVQFSAKLVAPKDFEDFAYSDYLARFGVYSVARQVDDFEIIAHDRGNYFVGVLYQIKNVFSKSIEKILPEPYAAFMLGLLIGAKKALPEWLLAVFATVGISHIIAISGYNISILARISERFLGKIGRKYALRGTLALVFLFVVLTGAQASIVRAGIMGALLVASGMIGRKSQAGPSLILAGTIMVILNPLILRSDVGFQLSFLATIGLIYLAPLFDRWFASWPTLISEPLSATLSAQALALPIIVVNFHSLSLISPLANVLVLGLIPVAMLVGFLSGIFGLFFVPIGQIVGFISYVILAIIIKISLFLSQIPYASMDVRWESWWIWFLWYGIILIVIYITSKKGGSYGRRTR